MFLASTRARGRVPDGALLEHEQHRTSATTNQTSRQVLGVQGPGKHPPPRTRDPHRPTAVTALARQQLHQPVLHGSGHGQVELRSSTTGTTPPAADATSSTESSRAASAKADSGRSRVERRGIFSTQPRGGADPARSAFGGHPHQKSPSCGCGRPRGWPGSAVGAGARATPCDQEDNQFPCGDKLRLGELSSIDQPHELLRGPSAGVDVPPGPRVLPRPGVTEGDSLAGRAQVGSVRAA